jgi:hypothetical protein
MKKPLLVLSFLALVCSCEKEPTADQIVPREQVPP